MKNILLLFAAFLLPLLVLPQSEAIHPSLVSHGTFMGVTPPLRELPAMSPEDYRVLDQKLKDSKELNEGLSVRSYPFADVALPKGDDPAWQKENGKSYANHAPVVNVNGQNSSAYPPDCNGTVGPNHYMQTVNSTYAIYDKTGNLVAGPTNMNLLFGGVPGSNCNDGDPIVLYDEEADRWLAVEFSLCGSNDMMLVAVSTTNDPTGTWNKYSFDVADTPDYEKFGIWQDGYYMGVNNTSGNDIYVFERSVMLAGGASPQMIGFNNAWRPSSVDGFMCVPPVDNDGPSAPAGMPGMFIAFNDDAIGGGNDELWIYELQANWSSPSSSTFNRTQQLAVAPFDCNFGNNWDNIKQLGTNQELDGVPQVIMNVPQYRNFGSYQTLVCCHTVDVDNTDHAGIRWYELRKTTGNWSVRQQGTYAPDQHSRWMGSIMMNGAGELGLGYSISSSTMYPGIRYCGQTLENYQAASGILDFPEGTMVDGTGSQTSINRWGDYSLMAVDPADDETFWYTNEYIGTGGGSHKTRIASFQVGILVPVSAFDASATLPCLNNVVSFTDHTTGSPFSWLWNITPSTFQYVDGTDSTSQNPHVQFLSYGNYSVSLTTTNGGGSNTISKPDYISVNAVNANFVASSTSVVVGYSTIITDLSSCNIGSRVWNFGDGATPATATTAGPHAVTYSTTGLKTITLTVNDTVVETKTDYINVIDPVITMSNASVATCSGNFFDAGGSAANYGNSQDYTLVLSPGTPGNSVQVVFNSFNVQAGMFCANDYLKILNGDNISAPSFGIYCGTNGPDTVTANNPTGSLTFIFHSNSSINFPGWAAIINCIEGVANPLQLTATAAGASQIDLNWVLNPSGDQVMLASSSDGVFGSPVNGTSYNAGDDLAGGGQVLYVGNALNFSHTQLASSTRYYYRIFSVNTSGNWSFGLSKDATTLAGSTLNLAPSTQTVTYVSGSAQFTVASNSNWSASSDASWCTVTPAGSGNGTLQANYEQNNEPVIRTANISVNVTGIPTQVVQLIQLPSFVSVPEQPSSMLTLYPNPTSGLFTIGSADGKVLKIEISIEDATGKTIISRNCSGASTYSFDLSTYPAGMYLANAKVGDQNLIWKIIRK